MTRHSSFAFFAVTALCAGLVLSACNLAKLNGPAPGTPAPSETATFYAGLPAAPTGTASATATATETPGPTPTPARARCDAFAGIEMKLVTLDWEVGQPLMFYLRMPGGVPGLETPVAGDSEPWEYSAKFGPFTTYNCRFIAGYPERLYCEVLMPQEYASSSQELELYVNGCEGPIYRHPRANVPEYPLTPTSEPDCADYTDADACTDADCVWDPGDNVCE